MPPLRRTTARVRLPLEFAIDFESADIFSDFMPIGDVWPPFGALINGLFPTCY